jgi:predicted negative regulator of RcsB-dependent stress response
VELRDEEGLIVSRGSSLALLKSNQAAPRRGVRLFDLEAWRRGDAARFLTNKHNLQRAVIGAESGQIEAARLELAKFYFAHGMATEALSMLRLSDMQDSRVTSDPQARLIKGAGEFLTEDFTAAAQELFHPALAGEWEAELWRAALAAASQDWELAAAGFAATGELIATYPRNVRARLHLWAVEASLAVGDMKVAEHHLDTVRRDDPSSNVVAQITYLVARGLYLEGDVETAAELWRRVVDSKHASSRIRARLALLDLALEDGSTTTEQAIAELERLRFAWRGDRFEFALLQRLGDLYILGKKYRKGLRLLRRAATHTPNAELSEAVVARMSAVFMGLFKKVNDELPPLKALALFEEFKELTPPGKEGDEVILQLAERLVEIDLLDRAAGVLGSQVEFRLKGPAKAAIAARLARVHLLNQRPIQALQALDASEDPGLTAELTAQRERLRAQALLDLDRKDEALAALGAGSDPETLGLRTQILRRQKNWSAAVLVLERLVPDAPPPVRPLREDESKAVVELAVALTMSGNRERLRSLGRTYKEAMSRGPHAQTFTLLVGDLGSTRDKSVEEELAGVSDIEAFIASYRKGTRSGESTETQ